MELLSVKTSDGLYLNGLLSRSASSSKKIIINIHGMSGSVTHNSYYIPMHQGYPKAGFAFLATENRGSGSITFFRAEPEMRLIGNTFEVFEDCVHDINAWVIKALELGFEEIWLQGHSLGPSKILYYMNNAQVENIKGLILLSPSDMIGLVNDPEGILDHEILLPEAKRLVDAGKPDQVMNHLLWGCQYLSAKTYLNFFSEDANTAVFNFWSDSKWESVNVIELPVFAITGTEDDGILPVIDPSKAMEKLKTEFKNSPRFESVVYEGAEHDFIGFENQIVEDVIKFITK